MVRIQQNHVYCVVCLRGLSPFDKPVPLQGQNELLATLHIFVDDDRFKNCQAVLGTLGTEGVGRVRWKCYNDLLIVKASVNP
ncbi:MAG TPA: hypothetical protein VOA41_07960 [Candidatus Dormibacteraeota bacterium]|nr:hypothetical protein [Candidatus Dormibacteraeota bacterium]